MLGQHEQLFWKLSPVQAGTSAAGCVLAAVLSFATFLNADAALLAYEPFEGFDYLNNPNLTIQSSSFKRTTWTTQGDVFDWANASTLTLGPADQARRTSETNLIHSAGHQFQTNVSWRVLVGTGITNSPGNLTTDSKGPGSLGSTNVITTNQMRFTEPGKPR